MTIIVGNAERSDLKAAMARARAHPVPWELLRRVSEQDVEKSLADEPPPAEFVDLPFGYVVAINFEKQPAGRCLHISVSGPWPRVAPNMVVCAMIFSALDVPEEADDVWTEEFLIDGKKSGRTLNVLWLVEPRKRQGVVEFPDGRRKVTVPAREWPSFLCLAQPLFSHAGATRAPANGRSPTTIAKRPGGVVTSVGDQRSWRSAARSKRRMRA